MLAYTLFPSATQRTDIRDPLNVSTLQVRPTYSQRELLTGTWWAEWECSNDTEPSTTEHRLDTLLQALCCLSVAEYILSRQRQWADMRTGCSLAIITHPYDRSGYRRVPTHRQHEQHTHRDGYTWVAERGASVLTLLYGQDQESCKTSTRPTGRWANVTGDEEVHMQDREERNTVHVNSNR